MVSEFRLPDVGEGLVEAELSSWRVAIGDAVQVNDVVCEIETAKSVVELPSPFAGIVSELLVPEGETVAVGTPIMRITTADHAAGAVPEHGPAPAQAEPAAPGVETPAAEAPEEKQLTLVGYGPRAAATTRRPRRPVARVPHPARIITSPTFAEQPRETREAIKGVRREMGRAMVRSVHEVPHVTEWVTLDATRTVELVARLRSKLDVRVSPLLVVAKACLLALRRTPGVNAWWDEERQELVLRNYVNLGIAAASARGLIVPNIKDADAMSLSELAAALADLTERARGGKMQPAALTGGTFTITNIGPFGVDGGTPIINPGESAILCVGAIARRPWVVGEDVVARDVVTLSLSFDHRHIDGAIGSQFLADVAGMIEDPATGLLF